MPPSQKLTSKSSLFFILVTLTIESIGFGIVMPVLPDIIRKFIDDPGSSARIYGYFIAAYACLQFLVAPMLGRMSDKYGRRPVLLVSLLGTGVDYVFMALAPTLGLLFVGRLISGICGASFTVASAYIADVSDDSNRSKNFGLMGAGFGLGFILGPAIGGLLAKYGLMYPFLAAAAFNILNFIFGLFILPESLPKELRRDFDLKSLNPFKSLSALNRMTAVRSLIIVHFLLQLAGQTHPSMWALYTEHRFGWTATQVGISLAFVGFLSIVSQGALTGPSVKLFGERKLVLVGTFGEAISFTLFGLVTSGPLLYVVLSFSALFWASHPALQSMISREVPPNEQGELQGSLMSLTNLAAILDPIVMTTVFSWTSNPAGSVYFPGSSYILAGGCAAVGCLVTYRWCLKHRNWPT